MDTQEKNILIGNFLGMGNSPDNYNLLNENHCLTVLNRTKTSCKAHELRFNLSWDWLMTVIEKIENLFESGVVVEIEGHNCKISTNKNSILDPLYFHIYSTLDSKIGSTYEAVVDFIKWHNSKNK